MPSRKPRVALTMPDDLNALFDRISELNGIPKTKLIVELLQAYEPVLTEMLDTLEKYMPIRKTHKRSLNNSVRISLLKLVPFSVMFLKRFRIYD